MSPIFELPPFTQAEYESGLEGVYRDAKLVDEDDEPSMQLLAVAIKTEVMKHPVNDWLKRTGGALHRDNLLDTVFPTLVGPRDYKRQPNPDLSKAIYEGILRDVNGVTSPNAESLVQQLVMAEGWVLCRIALSGGRTQDGYYVTQSWKCLTEDFNPAYRRKMLLAAERYGAQMDLIIKAVPALANKAQREYDTGTKVALDAGANLFAPALAAAKSGSDSNGNEPTSAVEASDAEPQPVSDTATA